jgi:LPS sulfotransferase NodH
MSLIKRLNSNNFTSKRLSIELSKILIDSHILKGNKEYQKFIVLGRSRVGSNLLISYLNSHPNIFALGEMFGNNHSEKVIIYRRENPLEYLTDNCYRKYPEKIKAVGFKIFYYHPVKDESRTIWQKLKEDKELKILHVKRENILRTHLSWAIAGKTDKWTITGNNNIPVNNKSIELSAEDCVISFEKTRKWETEFDEYFKDHQILQVNYENLTSNTQDELENVQQLFNLPLHKLHTALKRQNPEPLKNLISNYSDLKRQFTDSEWGNFFEE